MKSKAIIHDIGAKTNDRCHICHGKIDPNDYGSPAGPLGGDAVTLDHLVPRAHGGNDSPNNLMLAHARCNSSRGTTSVALARLAHAGTTAAPMSRSQVYQWTAWAGLGGGMGGGLVGWHLACNAKPQDRREAAFLGAALGGAVGSLLCFAALY